MGSEMCIRDRKVSKSLPARGSDQTVRCSSTFLIRTATKSKSRPPRPRSFFCECVALAPPVFWIHSLAEPVPPSFNLPIFQFEPGERPAARTNMNLVARCAFGLEAIVARELQALGYETSISGPGQVNFNGDWQAVSYTHLTLPTIYSV